MTLKSSDYKKLSPKQLIERGLKPKSESYLGPNNQVISKRAYLKLQRSERGLNVTNEQLAKKYEAHELQYDKPSRAKAAAAKTEKSLIPRYAPKRVSKGGGIVYEEIKNFREDKSDVFFSKLMGQNVRITIKSSENITRTFAFKVTQSFNMKSLALIISRTGGSGIANSSDWHIIKVEVVHNNTENLPHVVKHTTEQLNKIKSHKKEIAIRKRAREKASKSKAKAVAKEKAKTLAAKEKLKKERAKNKK